MRLIRRNRMFRKAGTYVLTAAILATSVDAHAQSDGKDNLLGRLIGSLLQSTIGPKVRSTLPTDEQRFRKKLKPVRQDSAPLLLYKPWPACSFQWTEKDNDGQSSSQTLDMSSRQVRKTFLITVKHSRGLSTVLIEQNGKARDFNWVDINDGTRWTAENFRKRAEAIIVRERQNGRDVRIPNPSNSTFPVFLSGPFKPGQTSAVMTYSDDQAFAEYVYAGSVAYEGIRGILFDIITNRDGNQPGGPIQIGYIILNEETLMPLKSVMSAGKSESPIRKLLSDTSML